MRDFRRDWLRWTRSERIAATGICSFIVFVVPFVALLSIHPS
jgi:hypothetical protein